jgi:serine/threonine-protein kinase HipA
MTSDRLDDASGKPPRPPAGATSASPAACFVFCYLPGTTTPVVCGRFEQRGTLDRQRRGLFTYGRSYLARPDCVSLDPIGLSLRRGTFPPTLKLGGVYGAIRDAAPDAWGRRVIERARGTQLELPELDYLLAGGDDRAGALAFGVTSDAPTPPRGHDRTVALPELLAAAELLEHEGALTPETQRAAELLLEGVTMGGARPKAVVEDSGALWLAKFPGRGDRYNLAAVEAGLLTLAARCGMRVPAVRVARVAGKPVLLVRRFDRTGTPGAYTRARYLSALTLLDAEELPSPNWSYLKLADELRRRSVEPDADRRELFQRMAFNALVSNGDDHPRNHAIIAWGRDDWRLSELFDVVPTGHPSTRERHLALIAGRYGRIACRENLVSAASDFRVTPEEAHAIIDRMKRLLLDEWEDVLRWHGAAAHDLDAVRHAVVPAGFEDEVPSPG